jgi:hypothetical protein
MALMGMLAPLDRQVLLQRLLDQPDQQALKAHKAHKVLLDQQAHKEFKAHKAFKALLDPQEHKVSKA